MVVTGTPANRSRRTWSAAADDRLPTTKRVTVPGTASKASTRGAGANPAASPADPTGRTSGAASLAAAANAPKSAAVSESATAHTISVERAARSAAAMGPAPRLTTSKSISRTLANRDRAIARMSRSRLPSTTSQPFTTLRRSSGSPGARSTVGRPSRRAAA